MLSCRTEKYLFIAAILLFFSAFGCTGHTGEKEVYGRVRFVIDGDTVIMSDGQRVRYIGIDTPEVRHRDGDEWVYAPEAFSEEAKFYNMDLVLHKKVRLEFDEKKEDRYGRSLAYVYVDDGKMVNEKLIRSGLASVYTFLPNTRYREEFVSAQVEAMEEMVGMWRDVPLLRPHEVISYENRIVTIRGIISRVETSDAGIYLFLKNKQPEPVVLWIASGNKSFFIARGIDPENDYLGKSVEVTGKVERKKHLQIYVDGPFQIDFTTQNSTLPR